MMEKSKQFLLDLFDGSIADEEIKQWLLDLQQREESSEELAGYALAMREKMIKVSLLETPLIDLCGTGGVQKPRYNVSTTTSFVLASAGYGVVKHGNYGSKQLNGSFNFTEALGLPSLSDIDRIKLVFNETKLAFLFARYFHPAMKRVASIRQSIGGRTVFNSLGPLCNPASPTHQLLGTVSISLAEKLASTIQLLGTVRTLIVVGGDGTDELSLTGTNVLFDVTPTAINRIYLDAGAFISKQDSYACGDAEKNAILFHDVFSKGDISHAVAHHVALNAGAALWILDDCDTIELGYKKALNLIKSKKPYLTYEIYRSWMQ